MGKRIFNTEGPFDLSKHYGLPQIPRCPQLKELLKKRRYFILKAPSGFGKTQLLLELKDHFDKEEEHQLIYIDLAAVPSTGDAYNEIHVIANLMLDTAGVEPFFHKYMAPVEERFRTRCKDDVINIANTLKKPISILFDNTDHLKGATRRYFMRSLRFGHMQALTYNYPYALCFATATDLHDTADEETPLGHTAVYDEAHPPLVLPPLSLEEINQLLDQHKQATNQAFPQEAAALIHKSTEGVPRKINRIADHIVRHLLKNKSKTAITLDHVQQAIRDAQ